MILASRIRERMTLLGISQAELARRIGVSQPAIHALLTRNKSGTRLLHLIARELLTTPAYLTGETDDPDEGAPPPPPEPTIQFVKMDVALPSEPALARMFEGLLMSLPTDVPMHEQARLLAKRLPLGLSMLQTLQPVPPAPATAEAAPTAPPIPEPARP